MLFKHWTGRWRHRRRRTPWHLTLGEPEFPRVIASALGESQGALLQDVCFPPNRSKFDRYRPHQRIEPFEIVSHIFVDVRR